MKDLLLSIDCGTQCFRAILFDLEGNEQASSRIDVEPFHPSHPRWAEQDPDYFWKCLCLACQNLWNNKEINKECIRGVAITGQRSTIVNVDINGKPLRNVISWLDNRPIEHLPPLPTPWRLLFKATGFSKQIENFRTNAKANWISLYEPDVWKKTHKYLFLTGYFNYKMCGEFVDSAANQVGYIPFDYKNQRWPSSWNWRWSLSPITRKLLPKLIPCSHELGKITAKASEETGIPAGIPLIAAAGDKSCGTLGAGCIHPSQGSIDYGTAASINVFGNIYHEFPGHLPSYPAAYPGGYAYEHMVKSGYWLITWFKEVLSDEELEKIKLLGIKAEALYEDFIKDIPAGNLGLIFQPYLTPGILQTNANAKGAIIGIGTAHTKAHLYRAILEGVTYDLKGGAEYIENVTKTPLKTLRVAGGGSLSNTAMQITADIFGLPAYRLKSHETIALGAAIDAAVGLKLHPDFESAVSIMVKTSEVFYPDPESQQIYNELYTRVYKKMFYQLKALYDEIQDITHYP